MLIREGLITDARIIIHAAFPEENLFNVSHRLALDLTAEQRGHLLRCEVDDNSFVHCL